MLKIIEFILTLNTPPGPNMFFNGGYGSGSLPGSPNIWGSNPGNFQKLQVIMKMLSQIQVQVLPRTFKQMLNTPVVANVPFQGKTRITILESSIIMRWPALVARLIGMGANPNLSTTGIPLINQLISFPAPEPWGYGDRQAVIDVLTNFGVSVPPGFPGTHGYWNNEEALRRQENFINN